MESICNFSILDKLSSGTPFILYIVCILRESNKRKTWGFSTILWSKRICCSTNFLLPFNLLYHVNFRWKWNVGKNISLSSFCGISINQPTFIDSLISRKFLSSNRLLSILLDQIHTKGFVTWVLQLFWLVRCIDSNRYSYFCL